MSCSVSMLSAQSVDPLSAPILADDVQGGTTGGTPAETPSLNRNTHVIAVCLIILTVLGSTQALYAARSVLIPVAFAIVLAMVMRPVVRRMNAWHFPPMLSAALTVAALAFALGFTASQLVSPASEWLERTPVNFRLRQLQRKLQPIQQPLAEVSVASKELSRIAEGPSKKAEEQEVQEVVVRPPSLITSVVSSTSQFAAGALLCVVLTFFFLARGEILLERLASLSANHRAPKTEGESEVLTGVEASVSTYLFTVTLINMCLGATIALACWLIGLPNPILWGVMAFLLNFLPYLGGLIGTLVVLMVSLFTFDSIAQAAVAPLCYVTLTAVEGNFVTPSVLGRSMSMNPLVVILSLTYWTWLWGIGGAVLAVPLLAIFLAVCRQFPDLQPVARALEN